MNFTDITLNPRVKGQIFGYPIGPEEASIVFMPTPWSVSYVNTDTCLGPEAILRNSYKIGRYHEKYPEAWRLGMAMLPMPSGWKLKSSQLSHSVKTYLQAHPLGHNSVNRQLTSRIDQYTIAFKERIKNKGFMHMQQGKMVGLVGGEQICALGLIEACTKQYDDFGILHIDAHADMKKNYHGFTYAHATVMYHALQIPGVTTITQLGLRDYTAEEAAFIDTHREKIHTFTGHSIKKDMYEGTPWKDTCYKIINTLPQKIYISFDIDALDPKLCPTTPRPVPGGLDIPQIFYLLDKIVESGKKIIAFDLSEIAFNGDDNWDGLVGSYLLYNLAVMMAASQGKL